jgi:transposase-like protein
MSQAARPTQIKIVPCRLRALVALRYGHLHQLCARLGLSPRTLSFGMQQARVSARVAELLAQELGTAAWSYVGGLADTLPNDGGRDGSA